MYAKTRRKRHSKKIFSEDNLVKEEGCDSSGSWNVLQYEIGVAEAKEIAKEYGLELVIALPLVL